ncbi:Uncharacterised protein [uncultured archaeon]|nr:Uncharacterised protein [uncultured archaeon]
MEELGIDESKFMEIMEFMNNNAMVSVVQPEAGAISPPPLPPNKEGEDEGAEGAGGEEEGAASEEGRSESGESEEEAPAQRGSPRAKGKTDPGLLSPLEKILFEKYGELGVQIYGLIDGEKTAEEILRETGVSEAKLVEILEFMDEQGIIKLEKPAGKEEEAGGKSEPEEGEENEEGGEKKAGGEAAREPRFKPMIEEEPEEKEFVPPKAPEKPKEEEKKKKEEDAIEEGIVPIDVPQMEKITLVQKAALFAELNVKFGKNARELVNGADGKRDFIELSLATGLSLFDIDTIMAYFGKKGFISFRQLARDDIKKKYGEDGFAIYKRFGRDGILLYEMIGKEASLKDIITRSRIDPDRAIEIFVFIHKVLGLDIPLDKNVIYRQLGLKK